MMCDFSAYGEPSAEWLAIEATIPVPNPGLSLQELKIVTNRDRERLAAEAMKQLGASVKTQDYTVQTRDGSSIEARSYRPSSVGADEKLPVYIHLHGGGFIFGTLAGEDATCSRIATAANVVVFNVNYRHTPEYTYPTANHDTEDAFKWLHDHIDMVGGDPAQVVMGGISAGAWLTSAFTLARHLGKLATSYPQVAGQVLMIPPVVHMDCAQPLVKQLKDPSVSSYVTNKDAPTLPLSTCRFFEDLLVPGTPNSNDLLLNPGLATSDQVKGLPPTTFGIAGLDILRDEGLLYAKLLTEAGVPTDISVFKGLPHAFRRFGENERLSEAKRWDRIMSGGIRWALAKPEATHHFTIKTE